MKMLCTGQDGSFPFGCDLDGVLPRPCPDNRKRRPCCFRMCHGVLQSGAGSLEAGPSLFELCEIEALLSSGIKDQTFRGLQLPD